MISGISANDRLEQARQHLIEFVESNAVLWPALSGLLDEFAAAARAPVEEERDRLLAEVARMSIHDLTSSGL